MKKGETIDFSSRRKQILQERDNEKWEEELRNRTSEDYKKKFVEIMNYWDFDRAFLWLYEQIQAAAGIITYDEAFEEPPCSDEEVEARKRTAEESADHEMSVRELLGEE